ncbi:hypothetical protein SEI61121_18408 [Salmonella enterica subsp. indica serovar 6,14,25:z10:1,(2),7 str. 1121]|uniref:Uncharacterized protein n=1 Tax=Salmonella enterica subsp. indica serovar 6,14,25:z10:1,(2),7 str. 1121 TaxID=1173950 RepID=V1GWC2_SALER|nr:hypothetical protein SEI61121_18408 [Salmonella enterica subsp. indica serovar 6,14,25:z10:1,(2),7 str. 1121]
MSYANNLIKMVNILYYLKQKPEDHTEAKFIEFLNELSANPRYQGEMDRESTSTR